MSGNKNLNHSRPAVPRLFFALWPPTEIREQLIAMNKTILANGRCTRDENLHVTLRFLGSVTDDQLPCIEQVASNIKASPFEFILDRLVFKQRQEMIWLTTDQPVPAQLDSLVNQLEDGLQECGFLPAKYSYKPHITIRQKANKTKGLQEQSQVKWLVDAFVLVSSKTHQEGAEYSVVKEWKF